MLLETLAPRGIGGVLAGALFRFCRHDRVSAEKWQREHTGILLHVVKENTAASIALREELRSRR